MVEIVNNHDPLILPAARPQRRRSRFLTRSLVVIKSAAIPSSLRKINRRVILRHMVQVPAAARGELAEVAGTSCVTAGKIVDELLEQGVLENAEIKSAAAR